MKLRRDPFDVVQVMALRNEQILPSVVVIVKKSKTPARMQKRHRPEAIDVGCVVEDSAPAVVVSGVPLVGKIGNYDIRPTIIVIISDVDAHTGVGLTFRIHGNFRFQTYLFEGSVHLLMEQELLHGVVGNEEIDSSVAIIVGNGDAQSFGRFI